MQSRIKPKNKQNFFQKFLILLYFGFFSINYVRANPITLEGVASAIDGDTIIINNYKIRLNGVSAPELNEEGGNEAKQAMQKILENKTIKCSLSGRKATNAISEFAGLVPSTLVLYLFCKVLQEIVFGTAAGGTARLNQGLHDTYHYLDIV